MILASSPTQLYAKPLRYHISSTCMKFSQFVTKLALAALLIFTLSACSLSDIGLLSSLKTRTITLRTSQKSINLAVEVADTSATREKGLMGRKSLKEGHAMYFVFQDEAVRRFWMKDTLIPLDIIFFNGQHQVVNTVQGMEPCNHGDDCAIYSSQVPAMYAIEVPAGFLQANAIGIGDVVVEGK